MNISLTEFIGYLASLGVLLSFLMKEIKTLRIVNTIGCFLFVIYGVMLNFSSVNNFFLIGRMELA
jgi:uncharacterized protein with PQ loop repeat